MVNGSIFAVVTRSHLVVKLPRERVDALISTGVGGPFDAGKGRPLKQWMVVGAEDHEMWLARARKALDFVGSQQR